MDFSGINIVEHSSVSADAVWLIQRSEDSKIPEDIRESVSTPCILTGDAAYARSLLSFAKAINGRQSKPN